MNRAHPKLRNTGAAKAARHHGLMTVSQLAAAADEPAHAVRYYCRIGLLVPSTTSGSGYRLFDRSSLKRLRFIRRAQSLGFSLDEISGFISHAAKGNEPCPQVMATLDQRLPRIGAELKEIGELHARMIRAQKRWRSLGEGGPTGYEICRLIESEDFATEESDGRADDSHPRPGEGSK